MNDNTKRKRVALGLSGGVDSSVSAALLLEQGYDVTGVFLECMDPTTPGCRADQDRKDALEVALQLDIPFKTLDFIQAYRERVLEYFYQEYQAGRTPNPDTLCNREIKFGLFYEWAIEQNDFDYISTGHYARVATLQTFLTSSQSGNLGEQAGHYARIYEVKEMRDEKQEKRNKKQAVDTVRYQEVNDQELITKNLKQDPSIPLRFTQDDNSLYLQRGVDLKKDQSYFLYQLKQEQLAHILFPIGHLTKDQVRAEAEKRGFKTATKPDSQGICFVGQVNVKDFLKERIEEKEGEVVIKIRDKRIKEQENDHQLTRYSDKQTRSIKDPSIQSSNYLTIGAHSGVAFHTIGQKIGKEIDQALVAQLCRRGDLSFDPSEMPPLFVIDKDIEHNRLIVGTKAETYRDEVEVVLENVNQYALTHQLINSPLYLRIRHGGELVRVTSVEDQGSKIKLKLKRPQSGIAPGQAAVFYVSPDDLEKPVKDFDLTAAIVLGGGVII